jgi:transposase
MFLFANSKNGVSAKELQRQLGVTYKTAWRMAKQIRKLFEDNKDQLEGIVEVDETYIGRKSEGQKYKRTTTADKAVVMGMVERGGSIKASHIIAPDARILIPQIQTNIDNKARVVTDELTAYKALTRLGYNHEVVNHGYTYVVGDVYTNTIEGFWSQLKRSLHGTYHVVSKKYLQQYC